MPWEKNSRGNTIRKGVPWRYIRAIKQGRAGTQARQKLYGQLGEKISNKGASQGIPIRAKLFAIYFDAMLQDYDNALPDKIKQAQQGTYERNEFWARKVATHLWRRPNTNKRNRRLRPPKLYEQNHKPVKRDRRIYADGLKIETANIDEIYPELAAF